MSANNRMLDDDNIEIDGDEIIAMSSANSSDDNDELKLDHLPTTPKDRKSKPRNALSFKSLPSENSIYGGHCYEFQSDLLDSLRVLSISLQQELDIIIKYFPGLQYQPYESNILFEKSSVQTIEIKYQIINELIPQHLSSEYQVELILNILNTYPKEQDSCNCRAVNCSLLTRQECESLKDRLNDISIQHTKDKHNCLIMMMVYLDNKMSTLNKKSISLISTLNESRILQSAFAKSNSANIGNIGNIANNINENGFFDSLNSLHDKNNNNNNNNNGIIAVNKKIKDDKILPGSFSSFQDVLTSKTRDERKLEEKYAKIDEQLPAPKMCGAIWGRNGQLIFFNNIIRKRPKNGKKLEIERERDDIKSFKDYNKFIENRGANNVHCNELQSIRKKVFANHLDEDEDRFADEFVVCFSLSHQHSQQHQTKSKRNNNNKSNYLRIHHHTDTQHHIMPHLVLPLSHYQHYQHHQHRQHHQYSQISNKHKTNDRKRRYNKKYHFVRHGNAKIFCPGIIKFIVSKPIINFSYKLLLKCKLTVDNQYNVSKLCKYNATICKELGLNRLYKTFETLSTFLQTANKLNTLIPSPYHSNYMAKFVKKAVDELYLNNEIQGIAIIACLLRQSQYFALLFYEQKNTNCGYLLQSCVIHYLRIIKYRINDDQINDLNELEQFSFLLNQQKQMLFNE